MKIIKFTIIDISRSKWVFIYGLVQLILTQLLLNFSADADKTIVSMLNLTLILNPMISLIFSTVYIYNSREFIELLLAQPVNRSTTFFGIYGGLAITLCSIFALSIGLPFAANIPENINVLIILLVSGMLLTMVYIAIAMAVTFKFDDRALGLGISIIIWLFFAVIYDGLILISTYMFSNYPLELPIILVSMLNPIDLGRIAVMLEINYASLMGYTGAIFEKFFGSSSGITVTISTMILWIILPLLIGKRIFLRKDI